MDKVTVNMLPTGVPGLDEIMGGGLRSTLSTLSWALRDAGKRLWRISLFSQMQLLSIRHSISRSWRARVEDAAISAAVLFL